MIRRQITEIEMLKYQIKRYQAQGKGAMTQALNNKLYKLQKSSDERLND